ncbi:MFS transporter [Mycobacterium kansasii]|uniref:Nitrate/nitrite transporter NarK n=1 Tax=Mycobacterium attenuatum TaxID=2341086 RepID=A0A498QA98_9MYCO|nr:nitrate/nitrite transporter [Mycobacterium attenuatum]ORB83513.1 MFS transporter [Mycobacterium kansasii]ORB83609.1 MFS transporter [Mycobacterium kansasii]VBA41502.1 Nitrate/nitrite transporter NarK [Mycobacterium attenuatum]VBA57464.1 Nitrate/nitrite transporter NarK [Mycobacterium attenuatum]
MARPHRIAGWDPEDAAAWRDGNNVIARRNLIWSNVTGHIAFSIWYLWSVMVLFMPQTVYGFSTGDKLLLAATATFVGAIVRIPYAMATTRFGGRNWAVFSSLVLLIPTVGAMVLLANPGLPLWPYLVCAALTGLGGGNYAASLAHIEAFYPQRRKGFALGFTGGFTNLGSAAIQAVGLVALAAAGHRAAYVVCSIYLVLLAVAAVGAALFLDNLTHVIDVGHVRSVLKVPDSWAIAFLYLCCSGSFLGFAFAFGQVLVHNFVAAGQTHAQASLHAAEIAFIGPLLGSVARIAGGRLGDRFGGGYVTLTALAATTGAGGFLVAVSTHDDLTQGTHGGPTTHTMIGYIFGFIALFICCGMGKGSVFKLIPSIFESRSRTMDLTAAGRHDWERVMSGALIGFAGTLGALGAMGVNLVLRQSYVSAGTETPAFWVFLFCYICATTLTWWRYVRPNGSSRPISKAPRRTSGSRNGVGKPGTEATTVC